MSNRLEYLVKYSVAPPPSRDYYSLKVFQDEIILYLWRISHGPHKAPIVYRSKFTEFNQEKSLQNEIHRGFGKYLLKQIQNIAEGNKNTLLTLPASLIEKISRYLEFTDIIKLSSLSHIAYEVFNADSVWQILYMRDKNANFSSEERHKIIVSDWKELYKDIQMQASIKDQRNLRVPSSVTSNAKTNKLLIRPISDAPKSILNKTSTIKNMTKKRSESSMANLVRIPLTTTMPDTRFRTSTKHEKPLLQTKDIKSTNSIINVNKINLKKHVIMPRTTPKQETESVPKHNEMFDEQLNRTSKKYSNKINNVNMKSTISTQEKKLKCKTQTVSKTTLPKNIVGNIKSSPVLTQNLHSKTQSKIKSKPKKKVIATKSEILNTDKALLENHFIVGNGNFDLADVNDASLKNIRSPRSIFDYDFSYVQQTKKTRDILDIRHEIQNIDKLKQLKLTGDSVINNFSNKMFRGDRILEKLSEKSEPFSEASNESLVNNKKSLPGGDNQSSSLSEKYLKAREDFRKSLNWKQSDLVPSQNQWDPYPDISLDDKSFISPRKVNNNRKKSSISKTLLKTSSLKPYASNSLESRKEKNTDVQREVK
ncbi:PREDICTED: uncharacterized protein LOC105562276 [Vollenhovia emeryi]|uniref:uncharacterized protein LOC105562276 n=1 Tax=Vollenhovia emeryi TaxID=411798 RepID=UPI0005F47B57|nr:PREDICTED: uncharacterized protein LOC105562276 [Vollenhovia emeryi]